MRSPVILVAAVLMLAATMAPAQGLRDPTRPPGADARAGRAETTRPGWILQSVLISPERRYAIINGEVVPVGGTVAGAELIAIAEERVTLRTADGTRILHLFPDVKRMGAAPTGRSRAISPQVQPDPKVQRSGEPGMKNENDE